MLGIWILGPFFMSINATFYGGGFAKQFGWLGVIIATLFFPVMTPLLAVYDGSIPNLLLVTMGLGLMRILGLMCIKPKAIVSN